MDLNSTHRLPGSSNPQFLCIKLGIRTMVTAQVYLGDVLEISQMSVGFSSTKVDGYGHLFLWLLTTGLSQFLLMWVSLPGPSNMVTDFYQHKKENNSQYIREKLPSLRQSNFRDKPLFLHSSLPR